MPQCSIPQDDPLGKGSLAVTNSEIVPLFSFFFPQKFQPLKIPFYVRHSRIFSKALLPSKRGNAATLHRDGAEVLRAGKYTFVGQITDLSRACTRSGLKLVGSLLSMKENQFFFFFLNLLLTYLIS